MLEFLVELAHSWLPYLFVAFGVVMLALYLREGDWKLWPALVVVGSATTIVAAWNCTGDGRVPGWTMSRSPALSRQLQAAKVSLPFSVSRLTCWPDQKRKVDKYDQFAYTCDVQQSDGQRFRLTATHDAVSNTSAIDSAGLARLNFELSSVAAGTPPAAYTFVRENFMKSDEAATAVGVVVDSLSKQLALNASKAAQEARDDAHWEQTQRENRATWN